MALNASIATIGSYTRLERRLAFTGVASAPLPSFLDPAPVAATDTRLPAAGSGPTLDEIEGGMGGSLPTALETGMPEPTVAELPGSGPMGGGRHFLAAGSTRTLRQGDSGADVSTLQRGLAAAGYNPGSIDGQLGPQTAYALRSFQQARGLMADAQAGPATRTALGLEGTSAAPHIPAAAPTASPRSRGVASALVSSLHNCYKGRVHKCFLYAWTLTTQAGGCGIGSATRSTAGRNAPVTHLDSLIQQGQVRPGDVVYVNRSPGADPSSKKLAYGPHWFVYVGNDRFADQYGVRDAQAMAQFVPGRRIDSIYHPFAGQGTMQA